MRVCKSENGRSTRNINLPIQEKTFTFHVINAFTFRVIVRVLLLAFPVRFQFPLCIGYACVPVLHFFDALIFPFTIFV